MKRFLAPAVLSLALLLSLPAAVSAEDASPAQKVPVIDGAAGSCSLDLTVTADGKPAYAAKVRVHIAYGFGGFRKLDLEASTNVDGKVKFTGLPAKVRRGAPLEFVRDGVNGFVLPPEPGAIARQIDLLFERKPTAEAANRAGCSP